MQTYVGIDGHRRLSQIAVMDEGGRPAVNRNVSNGRESVLTVTGNLPVGTPVAFGWGWLIELLQDYGFESHMAHPLQCKAIASARLKNDKVDAATLAHLLRSNLLPEAWIAPQAVREQRPVLSHRAQLVRLCALLRNRTRGTGPPRLRPPVQLLEHARPGLAGRAPAAGRRPPGGGRPAGDHRRTPGGHRPDKRGPGPQRKDGSSGEGAHGAAGCRPAHRDDHCGGGRGRHPVLLGPQAPLVGRAHPALAEYLLHAGQAAC